MRVITGTARGRRLKELEGQETRPTTDRVKEGMSSALHMVSEGLRVFGLFAGTASWELRRGPEGRSLLCSWIAERMLYD